MLCSKATSSSPRTSTSTSTMGSCRMSHGPVDCADCGTSHCGRQGSLAEASPCANKRANAIPLHSAASRSPKILADLLHTINRLIVIWIPPYLLTSRLITDEATRVDGKGTCLVPCLVLSETIIREAALELSPVSASARYEHSRLSEQEATD
jgi:hypothetical protein